MKWQSIVSSVGLLLLLLVGVSCSATNTPATPAARPPGGASEQRITAKGTILPAHFARLSFPIGGTLAKLAVKEGEAVKAGDTVAQLDTRDLEMQVRGAQDALELAQAMLAQAKAPASEPEISSVQAIYDSAVQGLNRLKKGATEEDLAAAQAALDSALAALYRVQNGGTAQEVAAAKASYDGAVAVLNRLQNGPTGEELAVLQAILAKAKAALDAAQAAYDRAGGASNPAVGMLPTSLALQAATLDYQIAQANFEKANKPDSAQLAQAQAAVAQAQANLNRLTNPEAASIAQAQAVVAQAQAVLALKKRGATQEDIQQAEDAVKQAQAALDLKKRGARPEDAQVAQVRVQQAQTGLDQARAALVKARLAAPFDATVTSVAPREGEVVQAGTVIATVADLSQLRVDTTDLDEFGAAKVKVGQPVKITVNAFNDKTLTGKVTSIAQQSVILATGDVSYVISIALDGQDPELRWGMTTKVDFSKP